MKRDRLSIESSAMASDLKIQKITWGRNTVHADDDDSESDDISTTSSIINSRISKKLELNVSQSAKKRNKMTVEEEPVVNILSLRDRTVPMHRPSHLLHQQPDVLVNGATDKETIDANILSLRERNIAKHALSSAENGHRSQSNSPTALSLSIPKPLAAQVRVSTESRRNTSTKNLLSPTKFAISSKTSVIESQYAPHPVMLHANKVTAPPKVPIPSLPPSVPTELDVSLVLGEKSSVEKRFKKELFVLVLSTLCVLWVLIKLGSYPFSMILSIFNEKKVIVVRSINIFSSLNTRIHSLELELGRLAIKLDDLNIEKLNFMDIDLLKRPIDDLTKDAVLILEQFDRFQDNSSFKSPVNSTFLSSSSIVTENLQFLNEKLSAAKHSIQNLSLGIKNLASTTESNLLSTRQYQPTEKINHVIEHEKSIVKTSIDRTVQMQLDGIRKNFESFEQDGMNYATLYSGSIVENPLSLNTFTWATLGLHSFQSIDCVKPELVLSKIPPSYGECHPLYHEYSSSLSSSRDITIRFPSKIIPSSFHLHHLLGEAFKTEIHDALYNFSFLSAPVSFMLFGLEDIDDTTGHLLETSDNKISLGTFQYDISAAIRGNYLQRFDILQKQSYGKGFRGIMFSVLSNNGHPTITCIYRLEIHGTQV